MHYAKNIVLQDGSTPYHYIQKIKESNVTLALDTNQIDYRNDGYSFKWHCNSYEVVFYDKIKELEKTKQRSKRTIEKDGILQLKLLDKLANRKKLEILRMEVRLNRRKIKQLLTKVGIKANLTFKGLFKPAIAKKVLLHYVQEIENGLLCSILKLKATRLCLLLCVLTIQSLARSKFYRCLVLKKHLTA